MADHNRRLAGAIAAYGKSLDVNKKRRPASANVFTERSVWYLVYLYTIRDMCGYLKKYSHFLLVTSISSSSKDLRMLVNFWFGLTCGLTMTLKYSRNNTVIICVLFYSNNPCLEFTSFFIYL